MRALRLLGKTILWMAALGAAAAVLFILYVEIDHRLWGRVRERQQARRQAKAAREYIARRVEVAPGAVLNPDGGCLAWLDMSHCEYSFRSAAPVRLRQPERYAKVDCGEVEGPLQTLGYEGSAIRRFECWSTDTAATATSGSGYARDAVRGIHLLWEHSALGR